MAVNQVPTDPEIYLRAWGAPGEPGDPMRIQQLARLIVGSYETLMRTTAELRNQVVPSECQEAYDLVAQLTDRPVQQIRAFIDSGVSEIDGLHDRLVERDPAGEPLRIVLNLDLFLDEEVLARVGEELDRIENAAADD